MDDTWQWTYLRVAIAAGLLVGLHLAEDFVRGAGGGDETGLAISALVVGVLLVLGLIWSVQRRTVGYVLVGLVLLVQGFLFTYLFHALGSGDEATFTEIASQTGAWGPVFVFADLLAGVTSLVAAIAAGYLIAQPDPRRAGTEPVRTG